ncbi:hypothetical protein IV102_04515 [bacterium]|nr:hypothetical protein [bacterium]
MYGEIHNTTNSYAPVARADSTGRIYSLGPQGREVGHKDERGIVFDANWKQVGRVDQDGQVHDQPYGHHAVGRVTTGGVVYSANHQALGRVDASSPNSWEEVELSGAAYLLLLNK